jgi:hypothetical protein
MFATFNVKADRLSVLKTSFVEELILTGRAPSNASKVISVVAFRCARVRWCWRGWCLGLVAAARTRTAL